MLKLHTEKHSDSVLWNQLKSGDEESFSLLFEKYYVPMVNYGKKLLAAPDAIYDCVQDVFVDIWIYRESLTDVSVVKAYLLSCLRKRIARLHEQEHIFQKLNNFDSLEFLFDFSIEDKLIADETIKDKVEQLNIHINNLPPRQKEALYLRYHQELSVDQIAVILDMNYQSTKNLLHRTILQLRRAFSSPSFGVIFYISINC
jgi:RNA polymerase sigma factor (sigma-70 family)